MLLSNRFKFLFVHIAKTGGTSIRASLASLIRRDPLCLPLFVCNRMSQLSGHRIGANLPRHAAAIAAKELMRQTDFESLFKFAFVRNPWDRQVSCFHHMQREQPQILEQNSLGNFRDFTRWLIEDAADYRGKKQVLIAAIRRVQIEHLVDFDDQLIVDQVGRFEQLHSDFARICTRLGQTRLALPHRRRSAHKKDFRSYYDDRTTELVARHFRRDIETFGYRFKLLDADGAMRWRTDLPHNSTVSSTSSSARTNR